ncbi:MAG: hypothetical protein M0Z65_09920 [Firmicutes bacterium]|uniref:MOSC domain-containing protein n=1 Tax=Melghirimyces thermohalophilus TaxID=1236220 RepID=A0A1G6KL73_9BACL|nr:hypothetical protein [Melghirimyces thermohalophilus]MDA8353480.1 hypothetical protein [Bacillota bacterium]SDC31285.1 hypothetical protein SAMN04488112_10623 [Melghirimyces thermohalophilus]
MRRWLGDALMQVAQARIPCWKLDRRWRLDNLEVWQTTEVGYQRLLDGSRTADHTP